MVWFYRKIGYGNDSLDQPAETGKIATGANSQRLSAGSCLLPASMAGVRQSLGSRKA